ncbi:hypothetical protein [Streptomyces lydicus]|uniref:hypothetical protein n=1 Tax=Streptomyces lydicus TaxID=47763 RepID=UPI00371BED85
MGRRHPADPHSRADARGLGVFAVATVLGAEEFGGDALIESLQDSYGSGEGALFSAQEFAEMTAAAVQNECLGDGWVLPTWGLTAARAGRLNEVDFGTLCTVRNVLAVLVQSSLPLRLASRAGLEDPALQHVERARAQSPRLRDYLDCAASVSRRPPAEAWKGFIPLLITICTEPGRLEAFQGDVTALDPALDDVQDLGRRALARLAPASADVAPCMPIQH